VTFWLIYAAVFREFGLPVFDDGPSWRKILGREVGLLYDDLEALPKRFDSEAWWIERGLRA